MLQWGRDLLVAERTLNAALTRTFFFGASMGPRLVSRGKRNSLIFHLSQIWLQWGRDLLVAERLPYVGEGQSSQLASMGPRLVSRGKSLRRRAFLLDPRASMGPRLVSRGKIGLDRLCFNPIDASMGPRLVSRGKTPRVTGPPPPDPWLQWGRDLLVAERVASFQCRRQQVPLQWGRDLLVAERIKARRLAAG